MLLLAQLASRQEQHRAGSAPAFLGDVLGSPNATAPLVRKPAPGLTTNVTGASFGLATELASVTLTTSGSGTWRRYEHGAHRTTPFGSETVTFDEESLEQYLTVESRQGRRRWTWKLDGSARARLLDGGRVGFVDEETGRVSDVLLGAAKIFDTEGKDVTPSGTRWRLVDRGQAQLLALDLDDAKLPLPYVIDPIAYRSNNAGVQNGAGSTSLTPTIPAAVREGDFLVAHVGIRDDTVTVTDPSGLWTLILQSTGTGSPKMRLYTFRKRATAADGNGSASYQFDISASTAGTAAITAWSGVDNTGTVSSASAAANSATITLPAVTANSLRIGVGAITANSTFPATCAAGAGCPRRVAVNNATGAYASGVYDGFAATGSTIVTSGSSRNVGHSISVTQDSTAPNASVVTFPAASGNYNNTTWNAGCVTNGFCGTASDSQSGIASVAVSIRQGTGNYWNGASFGSATEVMLNTTMAADDVSWSYTFAGASFPTEGDYTVRVVATDNGTNAESPGVSRTFKIDRTAPTSGVLALNSVTPAGSAYLNGTTVWYRGVETGGGNFGLRNTVTDNVGGSGAGGSRTNALGGTTTGWTHTASTVDTPAGGPYDSNTFTWTQNTTSSPTEVVDALDLATNSLALSTLTFSDDSSTNAPTTTFPVDTTAYNTAGWNAGCSTGPGDLCGTADDSSKSGVAAVHVSVRQGAGNYWNGASFASGSEVWNVATGTTSWSLGFAGANFPADGTYNFRVRSTDNVGNTAIGAFSITIDTGTPAAPSALGTTPASPANNNDPRVTGTAEAGSTVNVYATADCTGGSVGSGTAAAFGGAGLNPADVADNSTTSYTARATDAAGNQSSCSSAVSYVEDSAAPNAPSSLASTPASPANDNDPGVSGTAEAGSIVNLYATADCTGGSVASGTAAAFGGAGLNPTDIGDNSSTSYTARATDAAGNQSACSSALTYVEDSTNPSSTVTFPTAAGVYSDGTWNDPAGTASDGGGAGLLRVEVSIKRVSDDQYWNGTAFADGTENWRTATGTASWSLAFPAANFPADGDYVFRVRALDNASNTEAASSYTVSISNDTVPPDTSITAQPSDPTNATGASFSFTASEGGSTFECRIDGGGWSACTSPKSYSGLTQGSHTFEVRATDGAGNTDLSPASFTWTLDTTDPSSAITFPAAGPYNNAGWSAFSGTATDTGGAGLDEVEVSIKRDSDDQYWNGTAFADGTENWRLATGTAGWSLAFAAGNFPADGDYTVRVRATDLATNVQGTPASQTFTIDSTAPNTSITAQPNDPTNATGASFSFTASEGGSTFECRLDGGGWSACTSPETFSGLSAGSHTFEVRATDAAGNTDASPASFSWEIDTSAPASVVTFPTSGGFYNAAAWADIAGTAADGLALDKVEISIRRVSSGNYWNGAAFADATENWRLATGTSSWSLAFPNGNFPADGDYVVRARATDTASNPETPSSYSLTYDTAAPDTTITAQPSDPTNATGASFSFTASEGGSTFECRLDGGGWSSCASPKSYAGLAAGAHTFDVRATDAAGNIDGTPDSFTWTIDTVAPNTTITAQPSDPSNSPNADFSFTSSEGGSTFECRLDGGGWASCSSPESHTGLTDASHTFEIRATDAAGNTDPTPASFTWTVDAAAPDTTITAQPSDPSNDTTPSFSFTSTEGGSTFECRLDGGSWTSCASPEGYTGLVDGSHTFEVRATDASSNVDPTPASFTWTIDSSAPNTTITAQPSDPTNATGASFSFTSSEGGSTFECQRDGGGWASCTSPKTYSGLSDGSHTFEVRATDAAGNTDASPDSFTWTIDTAAPDTTITAQPNDPTSATGASFSFTSTEGGSTFECRLDGGSWSACSSPETLSGLAAGSHTFDVRATDAAGNTDASPDSFTWTIDTAAPNTTITAQPSDPDNSADADFSFTSSEGGSTFECRIDGGAFAACTSPKSYTSLSDGSHTFEVRATDAAGNTDASPDSFTWTIDTAAPNTTITAQPSDPSNSAAPDFSFTSSEGGSTFECRLDGGGWSACASPKSYSGLSDGSHTFEVRATDAAGNTDGSPASFTWTIDTGAPSSTASFPVNTASYNSAGWDAGCSPSGICGTASDGGSGLDRVEVSIQRSADSLYWNGSAFASASEDWHDAGGASWNLAFAAAAFPADGSYTIRVRALDLAGNVEAPASRTFTVDTTPPDTSIDSGPANPTNDQDPDLAFSGGPGSVTFECRLDGGSWGACTSPESYTGLAAGSHTFDVRAQDDAGNVDPTPASRTWTIDLTAPSSAISFPANGGSYNGAGWNNPSGTAADAVGLDHVEVSLQRVSDSLYWNGTAFADVAENWRTATGTATWSLAFAGTDFPTDGDYSIRVRAVDAAGNVEAPSSRTFTVDTVPPATTIDTSPATPLSSTNASFTFSADQPGSSFECRLDAGAWASCTSPRNYTSLAEGSHTFEVRATDVGGNVDPSPASHTWFVDTVPPVATMDDPGQYLKGTVNLNSTSTDTGGSGVASVGFERSPAGAGTWSSIAAAWDTTAVPNALYDLRVIATDNAGNSSSTPALTGRWVDNLNPTVSVVDPGPVTGTVTIDAGAADAHSGVKQVEFQVFDGGVWVSLGTDTSSPYQASWETTSFLDGAHDLRAIATDYTDNVETSSVVSVVVDNVDPTVSFTEPLDLGFVNAADADPFTLVADAADLGSGVDEVEFFLCTAGGAACTSSSSLGADNAGPYEAAWPLPGPDGVYHLKATARDLAGRSADAVVEVTVDRTTPDTSLVTTPGDPSRDATPDFTFSSTEVGSTFECSVDGGAWTACVTPHTTAPLPDGPRTFDVRAIDAAGNVDATPSTWAWLLDTTPPTATMNDPGANLRLTIALTSVETDPGASPSGIASVEYQYSVADADTWVTAPAAWDTTTVADGLYDLRVVVTDNAGNETQAVAVEDRRVDNSPPATAIDDPGANLRTTVAITGTASDTGSGVADVVFEISPDGASWSTIGSDNSDPYETSFDTASMPDGLYFFRTVASDVAGNVTEGAAIGPRRIDNTAPTASLNDPGANLRGAVNLSSVVDDPPGPPVASGVSVVMYEALIGGVWTGISQTWATTSVADGLYDLRVVVADVAGNQTISAVVGGRRVDNTPPDTSHNAPGSWQSGATTVSLGPSDGGSGVANTQYSVDGGGWNSGTSVNVSGDGIHTISFFSTDVAGNVESPKTATVMIDSTPPDPGANDPGNYLRGTVTLTANPDTGGPGGADVTQVEFQHKRSSDSTWTSLGVDTSDPYSATWATTPGDDGSWDLRFIVEDEAGNTNTTDLPSKIVDNTAPTGNVASPLSGSTVSGSITLGVSASDDNPIAGVEYFVNGGSIGTAGTAPFQMSWNSASGGDGGATISAVISDVAGNSTTTGTVNITVDNFAPSITLSAPAPNVSGTISLGASADGDTVQVTFERRPAGGGGWTTIGTAVGGPWSASFDTTAVVDGNYELRATAVDAGGNSGTSGVVTTRVDNTDPSGLLTAPGNGATVGSSAVPLIATGSDGGSGVASVTWQARVSGGGGFGDIASDSSAPFSATWDVTSLPSVAHDLRIVVTDLAGNTFTSPSITVNVDSTAPTVSLANPGSPLSGTVALSASTAGDATTVVFGRSAAGAASWSTIGTDGSAPYGANFDTTAVPDGLYDLRAVVNDAVGNTSQDVIAGVRIDNFVPIVVSTLPSNGSIVATANVITITASEDIASVTGGTLDGAPSVMPMLSGAVATFNVGSLSDGSHTLEGTIHDAAGKSSAFSVTFMVGVPAPAPSSGGGAFDPALPLVPTPTGFAAKLEEDGSLTLRWTPSRDASGEPFATLLYIDGIATQTFAPGETQVNLGPFDPADMRVFAIVAVDGDGKASPASAGLRSTSVLAGKTLDEARAILANRGFGVGVVRGTGTIVVAPAAAFMAPLGSKIDLELGTPTAPQARLIFEVVATKRYAPAASKSLALRLKTTRAATVTTTLLSPNGRPAYRWRFIAKAGITIKRLTMPPSVKQTGRYRLVFAVESGRETAKKSIVVQIVKKTAKPVRPKRPLQIVLASGSNNGKEIERGLSKGMQVLPAAVGEEAWTLTGASDKNVEVIVVDVDRYGLQLIRDFRLVFPTVRIIGLTNDPRRLVQAVRAGATIAVPSATPPKDLAKLIQRLASRRPY